MSKWRGYIANILGDENPARTQSMLDPISAWGNAEKEKWKAVQKAIPLTNRLGNFIGSIIGPAAIGLGGLLGDEMKAWRAANLERIAYKWSQKRKRRGIHPEIIKLLPFREAIGVIDAASKEDDDDVQELWARLIDNATNPDSKIEINKMHIELINSLNGIEACVLRAIFAWHDDDFRDENKQSRWKAAIVAQTEFRPVTPMYAKPRLLSMYSTIFRALSFCVKTGSWTIACNGLNTLISHSVVVLLCLMTFSC
jgi:hypothetical protein